MPRIENIDEIRAALDIVQIVGSRVPITPSGKSYKGRCPFHDDQHPSFSVSPDRGTWRCWSRTCGRTGGDAISFLMEYERLEFVEAAELAAAESGVTVRYAGRPDSDAPGGPTWNDLREACRAAADHYHRALLETPRALDYARSRGLTDAIIRRWTIGYACGHHVADIGIPVDTLRAAGILSEPRNETSPPRDPLNGRLVIPLHDHTGRVIGFTGRAMPGADGSPKYVNTPETRIFRKGELLFGYHRARELVRDRHEPPLILEGQLKALACIEAGIPAVAPGGTALTERQALLIARLSDAALVAYDRIAPDGTRDEAGIRSASDAAARLHSAGVLVEAADLTIHPEAPDGARDPDDLLAAGLPIRYRRSEIVQWLLANVPTATPGTPPWARQLSERIVPVLRHADPLVQHTLRARLSDLTGIPLDALQQPDAAAAALPAKRPQHNPPSEPLNTSISIEAYLCALCLQAPMSSDDPNWWSTCIRMSDLPEPVLRTLHLVALVRQRAALRGETIAAAIATCPATDARTTRYLRHWLTIELPEPPEPETIVDAHHGVADSEMLRRKKEGLI